MNKITLIGNLTRDPETTTLTNGTDATRFCIAVQRKFKKDDGTHDTDFFNCTAWGKLGTEVIAKYCNKGTKIALTGRMESQTEEVDGKNNTYWNVSVEEVELVGSKNNEQTQTEPKPEQELKPIDDDNLPF